MTASRAFTSEILATSAVGLARLAADRVLPLLETPDRYGADPRPLWCDHLAGRIGDLSLAVADDRPDLFADQVGWAKVAFASRGVPAEDLRTSLRCLRDVLVDELPGEVSAASVPIVDGALRRWESLGASEPSALSGDTDAGRLAAGYVGALLEGDRRRACGLVLDAVRNGRLFARDAILEVCLPAERELGRMWHMDELTVAEEHFVSSTTVTLMSQLLAFAPDPEPNGRTVVSACLEGDDHDIGLRAVTDLYELDGWRAVFLGGALPLEDLVWAVKAFDADLVLLSATLAAQVRPVREAVARLRFRGPEDEASNGVRILVGGPAFAGKPDLWSEVGADATATSAREAVSVGRRLVGLEPG